MDKVGTGALDQAARSRRIGSFLEHLSSLAAGVEPRLLQVDSTHVGLDAVTAITYSDLPEPGRLTAITYGLSLAEHPGWHLAKPELCISVRSGDDRWAWAIASLAQEFRGTLPFAYGDTLTHPGPIAPESSMRSLVIFTPAVNRHRFATVDVGDSLPIRIVGAYPIHEDERLWIGEHGLEAFWKLDFDRYDPRRPSAITS